ncbi:hypothetical protein [Gordonia paraffinivorans]|uniref:hypothetical protein n=1 Tax=Gordonia paraffinivorans TaxID=175628 RepID=UPI00144684B9|nr:hypothetical protein [Gordonia paraffinivorans]
MTDLDPDVIRFVPEADIEIGFFNADTRIGTIEVPVLMFRDQRLGPVQVMLPPTDNAAGKLAGKLLVYLSRLVEQEMRDEEDGEK